MWSTTPCFGTANCFCTPHVAHIASAVLREKPHSILWWTHSFFPGMMLLSPWHVPAEITQSDTSTLTHIYSSTELTDGIFTPLLSHVPNKQQNPHHISACFDPVHSSNSTQDKRTPIRFFLRKNHKPEAKFRSQELFGNCIRRTVLRSKALKSSISTFALPYQLAFVVSQADWHLLLTVLGLRFFLFARRRSGSWLFSPINAMEHEMLIGSDTFWATLRDDKRKAWVED